jgi:hypothetical protein
MPTQTQIYQIKVTLQDTEPPIWRRIQVRANMTLDRLHEVIQTVMGWTDSHLHQFIVGQTYFGVPDPDYGDDLEMNDEAKARLSQITREKGFAFAYEYDFGDSWVHELLLEKIAPPEQGVSYPMCLSGERACPPEDVGGTWGYEEFLAAIRDPEHPEHEDYLEWIGSEFDPQAFDLEGVNAALRRLGRARYR